MPVVQAMLRLCCPISDMPHSMVLPNLWTTAERLAYLAVSSISMQVAIPRWSWHLKAPIRINITRPKSSFGATIPPSQPSSIPISATTNPAEEEEPSGETDGYTVSEGIEKPSGCSSVDPASLWLMSFALIGLRRRQ